jgi:hypothetical protein
VPAAPTATLVIYYGADGGQATSQAGRAVQETEGTLAYPPLGTTVLNEKAGLEMEYSSSHQGFTNSKKLVHALEIYSSCR